MKQSSFFFNLLFIGLTATSFMACSADEDTTPQPQPKSIAQIAAADAQFSTLVSALQRVNLVSVLDGSGNFTVFAPTNAAFQASGINLNTLSDDQLKAVLLYHVLGNTVKSSEIKEGQTYVTTASGTGPSGKNLSMLIEKAASSVKINNVASVTAADINATNGVIHVVDKVILPLDIVGHAVANSNFSLLVSTLGSASGGLVNVLNGTGPFTVFAPVNNAFNAIATVAATLSPDQLAKVLTYHVIAGNVVSGDLTNNMMVTTVNGEQFEVKISNNTVTIKDAQGNAATVVLTDVQATNGVIHVLDKVILPNNL